MTNTVRNTGILASGTLLAALLIPHAAADDAGTFDNSVKPLLDGVCSQCHNPGLASGGINMAAMTVESLDQNPEVWRLLLSRVSASEMPPPEVPRPPQAQVTAFTAFVQGRLAAIQKAQPLDPGRVTAHRLNRNEYTNTIRDLLGDFRR